MTEKSVDLKKNKEPKKKKISKEKRMTIQRELRVNLTEKEVLSYSRNLAKVNQDLAVEENEKKEVMSDFGNKMNMLKSNIFSLSQKISNGYEYRGVDVDVFFDYKKGIKSFVRKDTGEVIEEQKMNDSDRQQEFRFKDKKKGEEKKTKDKPAEKKRDKKEEPGKKDATPTKGEKEKKDGWGNEEK